MSWVIGFGAAFEELIADIGGEFLAGHAFEGCCDGLVAPFAAAPFHQAEGNMRQVLHPFEVADDHTAGIDVEIGKDGDATSARSTLSASKVTGSVGGFDHQVCLDAVCITGMDGIFPRPPE